MNNKNCVTVPVLIKWTIYVTHLYFTLEGKKRQRVAKFHKRRSAHAHLSDRYMQA